MSRWYQSAFRILIAVCSVIGVVISVYMIVQRFLYLSGGFQYDELYSAITAAPDISLPFVWKEMFLKDVNLPLFNMLLFGWNRIFPYTVFWMHLFSALLGTAAILAAWLLAPKSWPVLKKGIFVSLMACSFVLVGYGAIVRAYSLSVLLSTIFTLQALRLIEQLQAKQNPRTHAWLAFFGVGFLGAYSHYFCAGAFFITALVVFLYTCYYKLARKWAFWGTAVVFFLWAGWLINVWKLMNGVSGVWWYSVPLAKATWELITFLVGPLHIFQGILYGSILALISLVFTYRKSFFKHADLVLPLAQIILICVVVSIVALRYNLWMDRYFLPLMPAILLLLAGFLYHLYERHAILLILWPVLLFAWLKFFWVQDYLLTEEFTGLRYAVSYLVNERKADQVLVATGRMGYPKAALSRMIAYYIPPTSKMELIPLTPQTTPMGWQSKPKIPVLMPVCSQVHLLTTSVDMNMDVERDLMLFGPDVCVFSIRPLREEKL